MEEDEVPSFVRATCLYIKFKDIPSPMDLHMPTISLGNTWLKFNGAVNVYQRKNKIFFLVRLTAKKSVCIQVQ